MLARWYHNLVGGICSLHVALQQQLPRLLSAYLGCHGWFDFVQAGPTSHRLTNPRHEPAAYHPPLNAVDPFHDETETGGRHSGQH